MDAIKTVRLTKKYRDVTAVDALDLCVKQGELYALLGINGAGKTTTIKMLTGLSAPTSGSALVMGKNVVSEAGAVRTIIGVSPQETAVAPNLTVRENLEFLCGVYGLSREDSGERIGKLTAEFSLHEILDKRAGKLSGGWQRRLSIALALIGRPQVLFLDEPTLGLDVIARSELWDTIRSLKGNTTVVLTTHYMEEAEALSDRVGIMRQGRLIAQGTPAELKALAGCDRFEDAFVTLVKEAPQ